MIQNIIEVCYHINSLIFINNIQVDMVNNIFLKDLNIFVLKKIMILRI